MVREILGDANRSMITNVPNRKNTYTDRGKVVKVKNRQSVSSLIIFCIWNVVYFVIERLDVCMYLHSLYGLNNKRNRARVYLINNLKFHWSFMHCLLFFVASNFGFIWKKMLLGEKMFRKKWFSSEIIYASRLHIHT